MNADPGGQRHCERGVRSNLPAKQRRLPSVRRLLRRVLRLRCAPLTPCPRSGGALGGTLLAM